MCVKGRGNWFGVGTLYAPGHAEALRKASASLEALHYDKPIRLEQDESATAGMEGELEA